MRLPVPRLTSPLSCLAACLLCLCLALPGCSTRTPKQQQSPPVKERPVPVKETSEGSEAKPPPVPAKPVPERFPTSFQFRLEAARHWQSIAEDAARALASGMRRQRCAAGKGCRALYVVAPKAETEFSRAFTNTLITALVAQGMDVTRSPDAALALHIDVQSLKFGHGDREDNWQAWQLMPNLWASDGHDKTGRSATPFPAADAHCEILVTLSVLDGQRYAARSSRVYYVRDDDLRLYERRICSLLNPCEDGGTEGHPMTAPPKKATLQITDEPESKKTANTKKQGKTSASKNTPAKNEAQPNAGAGTSPNPSPDASPNANPTPAPQADEKK